MVRGDINRGGVVASEISCTHLEKARCVGSVFETCTLRRCVLEDCQTRQCEYLSPNPEPRLHQEILVKDDSEDTRDVIIID